MGLLFLAEYVCRDNSVNLLQFHLQRQRQSYDVSGVSDLNSLLHISVQNVHLNSDLISNKISFKVPLKDKSPVAQPMATVWKQMQLQYMPPWPLHLLFRANEMDVYNRLFNFLLQVKMVELNLHHVWLENVKIKDLRLSASVWTLRNTLQYLIGNLQCYLQLDVIEGRFSQLCSALDQTQDFHQVVHLHSVFLSSVTSECFIDLHCPQDDQPGRQHPVNKCLMKILRLCDEFCAEAGNEEIRDTVVEKIGSQLYDNMCVLMNLLDVLGTKASGLRLLLLRLDYNRYFSSRVMGETTPSS